MDRYSMLYGVYQFTGADGRLRSQYAELGRSAGLDAFLNRCRIANCAKAIDDTNHFLTGFAELPGYGSQPYSDKPILIRYAPIHLSQRKNWDSNVGSFNALSCNGNDLEDSRGGKYFNTHFFSQELLLSSGEYNYLDHIFGTHLVTWQEKNAYERFPIRFDAPPRKITPVLRSADRQLVKTIVAALYRDLRIIVKLEWDCIFNQRAQELLVQIYSLLPPAMAVETGFAAYQAPAGVRELCDLTRICLFLMPAECDVENLRGSGRLILDLSAELQPQLELQGFSPTQLVSDSINYWSNMPWSIRPKVMEELFNPIENFYDENVFGEATRNFATDPVHKWLSQPGEQGSITSLAQLKQIYDRYPLLSKHAFLWERFRDRIPHLLSSHLAVLVAKAGADAGDETKTPDERKQFQELYQFGCTLLRDGDPLIPAAFQRMALAVSESHAAVAAAAWEQEKQKIIEAEKQRTLGLQQRLANIDAIHLEEMAAKEKAHQAALLQNEEAHQAALLEKDNALQKAVAAERQETERIRGELAGIEAVHTAALSQRDALHAQELVNKDNERAQAVAAEQQNTAAIRQQLTQQAQTHASELESMRSSHASELESIRSAHASELESIRSSHNEELESIRSAHNEELSQKDTERQNAVEAQKLRTEETETKLQEMTAKCTAAQNETTEVREQLKKAQRDAELLQSEVKVLREHTNAPRLTRVFKWMVPTTLVRTAAACLAAGILLGSPAGLLAGRLTASPRPTDPISLSGHETTPPATNTPETTAPSAPSIIEPPVYATTEPPTTAPPEEPMVDGVLNWEYICEKTASSLEIVTDEAEIATLLVEMYPDGFALPKNCKLEAVCLEDADTREAAMIVLRKTGVGSISSAHSEDALPAVPDQTCILWENEHHVIAAVCAGFDHGNALCGSYENIAEQIFAMITEPDDPDVHITYRLSGDMVIRLDELINAMEKPGWWTDFSVTVTKDSMNTDMLSELKEKLRSNPTPVLVCMAAGDPYCVYDYTGKENKARQLAADLESFGHNAYADGTSVIVALQRLN